MEEKNTVIPAYEISGIVVHGRGIGKLVGMPTANLKAAPDTNTDADTSVNTNAEIHIEINTGTKLPELGVYISKVFLDGEILYGVTHIGERLTIDDGKEVSVEVHILNFNQDIYDRRLKLQLFVRIRAPQKFADLSSLLEQIRKDCCAAREYWGISQVGAGLSIDIGTHRVKLHGEDVYLSAKEFDVLYLLYSNPDVAYTKERIYEGVWHEPSNNSYHAVENTVFQIRKRLKAVYPGHDYIKTIVGYGYRYRAENEIFE